MGEAKSCGWVGRGWLGCGLCVVRRGSWVVHCGLWVVGHVCLKIEKDIY